MNLVTVAENALPKFLGEMDIVSDAPMGDTNRNMFNLYTLHSQLEPLLESGDSKINFFLRGPHRYDYFESFFENCVSKVNCEAVESQKANEIVKSGFARWQNATPFSYVPIEMPDDIVSKQPGMRENKFLIHRTNRREYAQDSYYENESRRCIGDSLFNDVVEILSIYFSDLNYTGVVGDDYIGDTDKHIRDDDYLDLLGIVRSHPLVFCEVSYVHNICSSQNTNFLTFSTDGHWNIKHSENLLPNLFSRYITLVDGSSKILAEIYEKRREYFKGILEKIIHNQVKYLREKKFYSYREIHTNHYLKRGYFKSRNRNKISFDLHKSVYNAFNGLRKVGLFPILDTVLENRNVKNAQSELVIDYELENITSPAFRDSKLRECILACIDYIVNKDSINLLAERFGTILLHNKNLQGGIYVNSKHVKNDLDYYYNFRFNEKHKPFANLKWLHSKSSNNASNVGSYLNWFE